MSINHTLRRVVSVAAGMLLVAGAFTAEGGRSVASAQEQQEAEEPSAALVSNFAWAASTTGRVFEPYAEIPYEFYPGAPMSQVDIDSPARCETYAAAYFAGVAFEEAILGTIPGYMNPSLARSTNPEQSTTPEKDEIGQAAGGPHYLAECPSELSGHGLARDGGFASDQASLAGGYSETSSALDPDEELITSETVTSLTNLRLGELSIRQIDSWLKTELAPDAEPKVSYRITLQGISNGSAAPASSGADDVFAISNGGLTLGGQDVGGSDLVEQFNSEAEKNEKALEQLGRYGFRFLAPRFVNDQGRYTVESAVISGGFGFTARENATGQFQALRLGVTRWFGTFTEL
ncbi:MAG: hypothetical protein ACRDY7_13380 [Acidimicrobiia bacterium]